MSVIRTEFLVRGECACGWHMAAPEGAVWPECPRCGIQVLPPKDPAARLAYALMPEQEAFEAVRERRRS